MHKMKIIWDLTMIIGWKITTETFCGSAFTCAAISKKPSPLLLHDSSGTGTVSKRCADATLLQRCDSCCAISAAQYGSAQLRTAVSYQHSDILLAHRAIQTPIAAAAYCGVKITYHHGLW
jgi:hypothetical protein